MINNLFEIAELLLYFTGSAVGFMVAVVLYMCAKTMYDKRHLGKRMSALGGLEGLRQGVRQP